MTRMMVLIGDEVHGLYLCITGQNKAWQEQSLFVSLALHLFVFLLNDLLIDGCGGLLLACYELDISFFLFLAETWWAFWGLC